VQRVDGRPRTSKTNLAIAAGFPFYCSLYTLLHFGKIAATPRTVERLHRLADALDFPKDQLFVD
jgi:hypothetical protein